MKPAAHILILLAFFSLFICSCKKSEPQKTDGDISMYLDDIRKDPNAYYNGCVSCTLSIEKRGLLFKRIFVKATFNNETDYPIPIEKNILFIGLDGRRNVIESSSFGVYRDDEEVEFLGALFSRNPSKFPWDYYILPPHDTYFALIKLSKYYDISKEGKYKIQYSPLNFLTDLLNKAHAFEIKASPVEFDIE